MKHKLPFLIIIFIAVIFGAGAIVGIGLFQSWQKGTLPLINNIPRIANPQPPTRTPPSVTSQENVVESVVEKTSPSVVAIRATQKVFNPFDPFSLPQNQSSTIGTGFVVSNKGIVVTNRHVVEDTNAQYTVIDKDGKKYTVKKIFRDPILDMAILQIDGSNMQALPLGDSSKLKVGQTVIAIGNALGKFTNTVTTGIVSGLGRQVNAGNPFSGSAESLDDLIQTDAAINPGNSGGPLLNSSGEVIGVNVAVTEGAQNIGFAIPVNDVKKNVNEFITTGSVHKPFLGISYRFISKDIAILNEVPQGAYVQQVIDNSSAAQAGIQPGDIITKIDNQTVDSENKISQLISTKKVGDKVILKIWRDEQEKDLTVILQNLPNQ